jgi:hypothetical protein
MLWLSPPDKNGEINIGNEGDYFKNILQLFDLGKTKQQTGQWRTGHNNPT